MPDLLERAIPHITHLELVKSTREFLAYSESNFLSLVKSLPVLPQSKCFFYLTRRLHIDHCLKRTAPFNLVTLTPQNDLSWNKYIFAPPKKVAFFFLESGELGNIALTEEEVVLPQH